MVPILYGSKLVRVCCVVRATCVRRTRAAIGHGLHPCPIIPLKDADRLHVGTLLLTHAIFRSFTFARSF